MNVASIFWAYEVVICLWRGSSVCGVCREGRLVPLFAVRSKTPKIRPQGTLSGTQSLSRLLINWQTHRWRQGRQILMLTLKWKLWQRQWLGRIYNRFNQPSTLGVWLTVLHRISTKIEINRNASTNVHMTLSFQLDFFSMNPAKENVRWVGDGCVCQFLRPWIYFSLSVPATHINIPVPCVLLSTLCVSCPGQVSEPGNVTVVATCATGCHTRVFFLCGISESESVSTASDSTVWWETTVLSSLLLLDFFYSYQRFLFGLFCVFWLLLEPPSSLTSSSPTSDIPVHGTSPQQPTRALLIVQP